MIFALATQFLAWVSRVDLLEDFNIFSMPRTTLLLGGSIVAWIGLDAVAGAMRSEARRQIVFWTICALLGIAAAVVPPLLSRDGLAIGILHFFFGMWVITIAAYGALAWIAEVFLKKRKANQASEVTARKLAEPQG